VPATRNAISTSQPIREIEQGTSKAEDFPVHTKQKEIITDAGKPVAGARDKETVQSSRIA
jgi:hypothetical protein